MAGLLFLSASCQAIHIKIVTEQNPPLQSREGTEAAGFAVDLLEQVLAQTSLQGSIVFYPWARAYKIAQEESNVLIFSIRRTPKRDDLFNWVQPLFEEAFYPAIEIDSSGTYLSFLCKKNSAITALSQKELAKYTLAAPRGDFITEQLIEANEWPTHSIIETVELADALELMQKGRTDMALVIGTEIDILLNRFGFDPDEFKICYQTPMPDYDLYFAFSLETDKSAINEFNRGFQQVLHSGSYAKIYKKWFE